MTTPAAPTTVTATQSRKGGRWCDGLPAARAADCKQTESVDRLLPVNIQGIPWLHNLVDEASVTDIIATKGVYIDGDKGGVWGMLWWVVVAIRRQSRVFVTVSAGEAD